MPKMIDLTGQRFGKLLVIRKTDIKSDHICWECLCDCGKTKIVKSSYLQRGNTRSCGCLRSKSKSGANNPSYRHGFSRTRLYAVWQNMRQRCYNPKFTEYSAYGGRGIKVCDEWRNSFEAFKDWALSTGYDGTAPRGECTIDRIDVNGDYCPENCRWATMELQYANMRKR